MPTSLITNLDFEEQGERERLKERVEWPKRRARSILLPVRPCWEWVQHNRSFHIPIVSHSYFIRRNEGFKRQMINNNLPSGSVEGFTDLLIPALRKFDISSFLQYKKRRERKSSTKQESLSPCLNNETRNELCWRTLGGYRARIGFEYRGVVSRLKLMTVLLLVRKLDKRLSKHLLLWSNRFWITIHQLHLFPFPSEGGATVFDQTPAKGRWKCSVKLT